MEEKKTGKEHKIVIENRQNGILTGVVDVHAFDEETISVLTEGGKLLIKGQKLHIKSLNLESGEIWLDGKIDSLVYLSKNPTKKENSFLKHFFR